jgi:uncharacterized protein YggE
MIISTSFLYAGDGAQRLITVNGDADVKVAPDEVVITLGVQVWNEKLSAAKSEHDMKIKKSLAVIKGFGIEDRHIQTEYVNIQPTYKSYPDDKIVDGYTVSKTIVVTLKDIAKFEDLLTAVLESGVNYVHGIQFRTTELRKHRDKARSLAIKAAKEKAVALAAELDQKVGEPQTINEDYSGWWSWYGGWWGSYYGGGMAQNVVQNVGGGSSSLSDESTVAPGQITVNAKVTVSFILK